MGSSPTVGSMKKELLGEFQKIVNNFYCEINDDRTRFEIIQKFKDLIYRLESERKIMYSLMKRFIDASTPKIIDRGGFLITVELVDDRVVEIEEYCDIITDKEKSSELHWKGVQLQKAKEEETELNFLIGKRLTKVVPSAGDENSLDLIFDDGTILCIENNFYLAEE